MIFLESPPSTTAPGSSSWYIAIVFLRGAATTSVHVHVEVEAPTLCGVAKCGRFHSRIEDTPSTCTSFSVLRHACTMYSVLLTLGVKNFLSKLSASRDGPEKSTETKKG